MARLPGLLNIRRDRSGLRMRYTLGVVFVETQTVVDASYSIDRFVFQNNVRGLASRAQGHASRAALTLTCARGVCGRATSSRSSPRSQGRTRMPMPSWRGCSR
eukprot:scaffold89559_cov54-Phaeocystis_antarctica.AAC.1